MDSTLGNSASSRQVGEDPLNFAHQQFIDTFVVWKRRWAPMTPDVVIIWTARKEAATRFGKIFTEPQPEMMPTMPALASRGSMPQPIAMAPIPRDESVNTGYKRPRSPPVLNEHASKRPRAK